MEKKWNSVREQYMGIIQNLINNIDICSRRYVEEGDNSYLAARKKYIEELEELKTFIVTKEKELGLYKEANNEEKE